MCPAGGEYKIGPLAYIDSVSASQVFTGEKVAFAGHAVSSTGQVVAYTWRSSVNGNLSQLASFETDKLTAGTHTIWFRAQDNYGNWSDEVGTNVNVSIPGGPEKMSVRVFTATPRVLNKAIGPISAGTFPATVASVSTRISAMFL